MCVDFDAHYSSRFGGNRRQSDCVGRDSTEGGRRWTERERERKRASTFTFLDSMNKRDSRRRRPLINRTLVLDRGTNADEAMREIGTKRRSGDL